jgi:transposase-like protein
MSNKLPTLKQFQARFVSDDACLDHLMVMRYGERHTCEKCGKLAKFHRVKARRCYECDFCGYQVYPTAGTPFEATRTSLRDWFTVMFLFTTSRNGVSAKEVQRTIGVTYKTAWRMCNLIRQYMGYVDGDNSLGGPGGGIVEADKAFFGGKDKRGQDDKAVVLGIIERGGEVVTKVIPSKRARHVMPAILKWVKQGTRVATDEALAFRELGENGYRHGTVNHSEKQYVSGEVHTNNIEAFWSHVKRSMCGTYVSVSKKWLQTYLWEFEFRQNLRKHPHLMFDLLLQSFPRPKAGA